MRLERINREEFNNLVEIISKLKDFEISKNKKQLILKKLRDVDLKHLPMKLKMDKKEFREFVKTINFCCWGLGHTELTNVDHNLRMKFQHMYGESPYNHNR